MERTAAEAGGAVAAGLEYAPGGPVRRRRLVVRVVLGLALLAAGGVAWRYVPEVWEGWRVRSITEAAMTHAFPERRVIYEERPGASAVVREDPKVLGELAGVTERGGGALSIFGNTSAQNRPLAFLHERTSAKGLRRIVAVRIVGVSYTPADGGTVIVKFTSMALEPREGLPPAAHGVGESQGPDLALLPASALVLPDGPAEPGPIRIFAAEADPNDAATFVLPYEVNGQRKSTTFRLVDDANGRGPFVITVNPPRPQRVEP